MDCYCLKGHLIDLQFFFEDQCSRPERPDNVGKVYLNPRASVVLLGSYFSIHKT